ncbi:MAG: hypothetical protein ABSH32_21305 [Bryobacteraceae bacterium]|jgi:hypothetical protein
MVIENSIWRASPVVGQVGQALSPANSDIFPKSALVALLYKTVGQALSPANSEL